MQGFPFYSSLLFCFCLVQQLVAQSPDKAYHLLVGTYTDEGSEGLYVYKFDINTGKATFESVVTLPNPSFLALSADQQYVYVVEEEKEKPKVDAFRFDAATGKLTFLNSQPSGGAHPCYVATDKKGRKVYVGNYTAGNFSAFSILLNGALDTVHQMVVHKGKGVNAERQESPHVHATALSPDENYLFVPDLGIDKLYVYPVQHEKKYPIDTKSSIYAKIEDGGGPRHVAFHPNGLYLYLVHELTAKVSVFALENFGKLKFKQTVEMNSLDFKGKSSAADLHVSPDGKFLYASNRGDANQIVVFAIDSKTGKLNVRSRHSTLGKTPRNFVIEPSGKYLLVANQGSNKIVVFERNSKTGFLQPTGHVIEVGKPVCLVLANLKN
jgi:6-phosphogluconolactonase